MTTTVIIIYIYMYIHPQSPKGLAQEASLLQVSQGIHPKIIKVFVPQSNVRIDAVAMHGGKDAWRVFFSAKSPAITETVQWRDYFLIEVAGTREIL